MERLEKWRMVLGKQADQENPVSITGDLMEMDKALEALYDSDRKGGLGSSSPKINRWLGDIRKYFPNQVVQVLQKDALERLGLDEMLLEPELLESIEADVSLVGTLMSLNAVMPQKTRETARIVVRKVVKSLEEKLKNPMREALTGALNRSVRNNRPKFSEIDWGKTIRLNLKHYQPEYKTIIPERVVGFGKKGQALKNVILCVDQSGSMASSMVYSGVFGAVMASLKSIKTQMVVFDTAVVDLTKELVDPVDLLFGIQLGGGTDINKAIGYVETLIERPDDTIVVLITDLFEGGNERQLLKKIERLKNSGVQVITLLALSDEGSPIYDRSLANKLAALNVVCFSCTPDLFPDLMSSAIQQKDLKQWMSRNKIENR